MKTRYLILLILCIIIALGTLGFVGVRTFVKKIYNNKDCEFALIDHFEIRTSIDIPKSTKIFCNYNELTNTKIAVFKIEDLNFDVEQFTTNNHLANLSDKNLLKSEKFSNFQFSDNDEIYFRSNSTESGIYDIIFNASNLNLYIQYKYLDF